MGGVGVIGAERLKQVRAVLDPWDESRPLNQAAALGALAALEGCVLLTAEEAAELRELLDDVWEQFAYETPKGKSPGGLSTLEWLQDVCGRALLDQGDAPADIDEQIVEMKC
jgi:hypothetical protein